MSRDPLAGLKQTVYLPLLAIRGVYSMTDLATMLVFSGLTLGVAAITAVMYFIGKLLTRYKKSDSTSAFF